MTTPLALLRELGRGFVRLLYPGVCHVCAAPLPLEQNRFCTSCRTALTTDPFPCCPRCAATIGPFAFATLKEGCPKCWHSSFRFERVLRLGPYDGLLRDVILRLKHLSGDGLAELIGELWAEYAEARLRDVRADAVVPIPLHWRRRWGWTRRAACVLRKAHGCCRRLIRQRPTKPRSGAPFYPVID